MNDTRLTTFSLPAPVVQAMIDLADETNVSVTTIVTAALEQFLNRADRQADLETARRTYIDTHARYGVDGHNPEIADAFFQARRTLLNLLEQEEAP